MTGARTRAQARPFACRLKAPGVRSENAGVINASDRSMQNVKTVRLGNREVALQTQTGVVAGAQTWASTEISSSGGGGYVGSAGGYVSAPKVTSTTTEHKQVFVRVADGAEIPLRLDDVDFAAREGHEVTLLKAVIGRSDGKLIAIRNHTTRQSVVLEGALAKLFRSNLVPALLCLAAATIAALAFAASPHSPLPNVRFFSLGRLNAVGFLVFFSPAAAAALFFFGVWQRRRGLNLKLRREIQASIRDMQRQ